MLLDLPLSVLVTRKKGEENITKKLNYQVTYDPKIDFLKKEEKKLCIRANYPEVP